MDWEGIKTAYLDRERARLGLPTREQEAMTRAKRAEETAAAASALETQGVERDLGRARIEALPVEQEQRRRLVEAQIRNYDEPNRAAPTTPSTEFERIMALPPDQQAAAVRLYNQLHPRAAAGAGGEPAQPKTGWQAQYDQTTGQLMGYYHPATNTFRRAGEGNLPGGTRNAVPAGEMEKRGLLQSMLSDAQRLQQLIGPANAPTEAGKNIGWWSARENDVRAGGMLAPMGVDAPPPDVIEMTHIADNLSDMLLRARSGAQINEQEYQRLRKLMPNTRTTPEAFRSNLSRFIVEANNVLAARQGEATQQPGLGTIPPVTSHGAAPAGGEARTINGVLYQRGTGPDGRSGWVRVRQ